MAEVTIQSKRIELRRPSPLFSASLMSMHQTLDATDPGRVLSWCAAALAESWPLDVAWPTQPRPRPWRPGVRIETHGQAVFDSLCDADISPHEVIEAGAVAYRHALVALVSKIEVEAARDFSEAPKGG